MKKIYNHSDSDERQRKMNCSGKMVENVGLKEDMELDYINWKLDIDQASRLKKHKCKDCYYMDDRKLYAQVVTQSHCAICGEKMTFPTAHTDKVCTCCSTSQNICKHCGRKMD